MKTMITRGGALPITLVIMAALIFPVWRTCGPLHKSMSGPHLYGVGKGSTQQDNNKPVDSSGRCSYTLIQDPALKLIVLQ